MGFLGSRALRGLLAGEFWFGVRGFRFVVGIQAGFGLTRESKWSGVQWCQTQKTQQRQQRGRHDTQVISPFPSIELIEQRL